MGPQSRTYQTNFCSICILLSSIFVGGLIGTVQASSWPYEDETKEQRDARMAWWRQARFGMFIHWGVYAVPAGTYKDEQVKGIGEWIMNRGKIPVAEYKEYANRFNPVKYDPDAWVRLAKEAGMKYIVITSKHHDGFALFDSKVTDWDVVDATPYGKDLLKPLAEACRKHGIKLGFYYSQAQDWNHPGGAAAGGHWDPAQDGSMEEYIKNIAAPQVKEILTNYGDIAVLWWDTPTDMTVERADRLQPLITLQPGIITNNRLGGNYKGDTETPEQHIPATGFGDRDWETCMTINDTWGFKSYDDNWKSTETLIRNLVDIASKGGNYLLNVGPTSLGEIPQPSIERLKEIGEWMKINSRSIYETTASPFPKLTWGRCTKKAFVNGASLYLHVFDWPTDGKLLIPGLKNDIEQAYLVATLEKLNTSKTDEGVVVHLPAEPIDKIDTVVELKVSGPLNIQKILPTQDAKGAVLLTAEMADLHNPGYGDQVKLEEKDGKQNIGFWTDARARVEWPFVIRQAGVFTIKAEIALEAEQSVFQLIVNDQTIDAKAESTGGHDKFKTVTLGQTDLLEPGEYTLQIKPREKQWQPINLRSLTLEPIK
ncbi:MAG: alpha-L-fucosidase [Phycisphaerae bacterium]|nr:alpha-L-fucosidase [Phycisphaerae bacterium]